MALELKGDEFDAKVLKSNKPVLVDFFASWCGPCQIMSPIIDELAKQMKGEAEFFKVDVEAEGGLANQYQVMSVPTILIFNRGNITRQFNGVVSKEDLRKALQK